MRKIFGTASLHWLSPKSREMLIETVINNGFFQFDTASVYGLGTTNKYLGSLGLPNNVSFSAKVGLKSRNTFSSSRLEILFRKAFFSKLSKIEEDDCYSSWKSQFEKQMIDLGIIKVQRLLLHERFISPKIWELFVKLLNEYKSHYDEYGVSASWLILRPYISHFYDPKLLIQTTPEILEDPSLKKFKKLTLYGVSKICNENNNLNIIKKNVEGVVFFSSKKSRIENFPYK